MTVQCITCRHFSLRESPLARQGFGKCAKGRAYQFMSATFQRVCAKHSELDADAVSKRRAWLEGQR